ncbi:MAG: hypothetical protein ACXVQ5_10285 [Actinomycetota bacterium]
MAAVIFNPDSYRGAVPPCGSALGIAALTVEAGSAREAAFEGQGAIVGSQAGADEAARTLAALLDHAA